uniref:Uncharacterized protein n=1 Tax=Tetranychus urticae TaxID=32264 RepID=T1JTK0_TETUR
MKSSIRRNRNLSKNLMAMKFMQRTKIKNEGEANDVEIGDAKFENN